jgi:predicted ATP-grasp superfamily ATP-dependent carboligase
MRAGPVIQIFYRENIFSSKFLSIGNTIAVWSERDVKKFNFYKGVKNKLKNTQAIIPRGEHFVALAVARSLGKEKIKTTIISDNPHAISFQSKYCNNKIITKNPADIISRFSEDSLVMPTEEQTMIELSKNRKKYPCNLAFPDYPVLEFAFDKKKILERAIELKISCPETAFVKDPDDLIKTTGNLKFPVVIKPIRGLGGLGISFIDSDEGLLDQYEKSLQKFGSLIVQEKIPYVERYSVAILMNYEQAMKRCCVLRAIRCYPAETGPASFVTSVDRPDLIKISETLLESIGFSGIAEVEFVIDSRNNSPKLMEVNPRFWGSLQGAINAGVNFPFLLFQMAQQGDIEKKLDYQAGVKTRNVIPYEFQRLRNILLGHNPKKVKITSVLEFLNFYQDNGYFIFDIGDVMPFFSIFADSLHKRMKKTKVPLSE